MHEKVMHEKEIKRLCKVIRDGTKKINTKKKARDFLKKIGVIEDLKNNV